MRPNPSSVSCLECGPTDMTPDKAWDWIRYISLMDAREAGLSWAAIGEALGITAAQARISAGVVAND